MKKYKITTTQMIAIGYLIAILTGTFFLMLPIATKNGIVTKPVDALFTATTSICVTGLTTVVTAQHWSLFGQVVILCLIQFGGLGVITFTTTILLALRRRITLKDRMLIQEAYNLDTLRGLVKLTIKIIKGTFLIEGMGALLFATQFIPQYGWIDGIWKAVFHAISSFCNAGIDLIGEHSFMPYVGNPVINFTTTTLIVLGGIGFPVWWDVLKKIQLKRKEQFTIRKCVRKLELHSKIVLTLTACLLLFGTIFFFLNEYHNPETIGRLPMGQKMMASYFQSVTLRTAGYYTIPQECLKEGSAFVGVLLMFIGGSPSGTAGGVKTITVAVLILAALSAIQGKEDVEVFHRKISDSFVKKSLAVVMVSFFVLVTATISLTIIENKPFLSILYETASALATVGLSRDITMHLSGLGKLIIVTCMYIGRTGPITMALAFHIRRQRGNRKILPEEKVLVG